MILLLGGTTEAREIAVHLRQAGYDVLLTTLTSYGGALAEGAAEVSVGALDAAGMRRLLKKAEAVVDATHPFATHVSELAIAASADAAIPYIRFERAESALPTGVQLAADAAEAAALAVTLAAGGSIFLTVGTRTLACYVGAARAAGCRLVARVLPCVDSLAACTRLGLLPRDILAMQGPTSAEVDIALLRHYAAGVLVTKESGPNGGVEEKIAAAQAMGIPAVVVRRPRLDYPCVVLSKETLLARLKPTGEHRAG